MEGRGEDEARRMELETVQSLRRCGAGPENADDSVMRD